MFSNYVVLGTLIQQCDIVQLCRVSGLRKKPSVSSRVCYNKEMIMNKHAVLCYRQREFSQFKKRI